MSCTADAPTIPAGGARKRHYDEAACVIEAVGELLEPRRRAKTLLLVPRSPIRPFPTVSRYVLHPAVAEELKHGREVIVTACRSARRPSAAARGEVRDLAEIVAAGLK